MTVELSAAPRANRWRTPPRPAGCGVGCGRRWGCCCRSGLALAWELIVWLGYSNGRLVPPPTKIFATIVDLARSGELTRHIVATLSRVFAGFGLGRGRRHLARRDRRLLEPGAPAARSHRAGAARDPVDRLGAAVHPVARHFRNLESGADRGRGVFPGLSRRDGRDHVGRSQDRRGRPHLSSEWPGDDPPYPAARGVAGLCGFAARRSWAWAGCSWSPPNSWALPKGLAIS